MRVGLPQRESRHGWPVRPVIIPQERVRHFHPPLLGHLHPSSTPVHRPLHILRLILRGFLLRPRDRPIQSRIPTSEHFLRVECSTAMTVASPRLPEESVPACRSPGWGAVTCPISRPNPLPECPMEVIRPTRQCHLSGVPYTRRSRPRRLQIVPLPGLPGSWRTSGL